MKQGFLVFVSLFFSSNLLYAQQITLSGAVTDKSSGEPMAGVLVTLRPTDENKIVKFAQTSPQGKFEITLSAFPENHAGRARSGRSRSARPRAAAGSAVAGSSAGTAAL